MRPLSLAMTSVSFALAVSAALASGTTGCKPDDDDDDPPPPPAPDCIYEEVGYDAGESFPAADGCNTCWCEENGMVGCSRIACPIETCEYSGVDYAVGESFPATDGCNTCTCGEGGVVGCTKIGCACDPDVEYNRHYMGDPTTCMQIRFVCPENTTMFSNDCGCGCEQADTCPEWFNCMPSPNVAPCDVQALQAECPYSGIAW